MHRFRFWFIRNRNGEFRRIYNYLDYFFSVFISTTFSNQSLSPKSFFTLLLAPVSICLRLQGINQKESESAENIIKNIAPQFLKYQYYILFATYLVFEILLRLLSKYSQKLRIKIQENPFTIRLYFFIVLAIASVLIEIFG